LLTCACVLASPEQAEQKWKKSWNCLEVSLVLSLSA
jgi:hypothetical protein